MMMILLMEKKSKIIIPAIKNKLALSNKINLKKLRKWMMMKKNKQLLQKIINQIQRKQSKLPKIMKFKYRTIVIISLFYEQNLIYKNIIKHNQTVQFLEQAQSQEQQSQKSIENQQMIEQQQETHVEEEMKNPELQQQMAVDNNDIQQQSIHRDENEQQNDEDFEEGEEIQIENLEENVMKIQEQNNSNDDNQIEQEQQEQEQGQQECQLQQLQQQQSQEQQYELQQQYEQEQQQQQQQQYLNHNSDTQSEEEIIVLDKEDKLVEEVQQKNDEDDFVSGEEVEIQNENQGIQQTQNNDDDEDEFEEGEVIQEQENNAVQIKEVNDQTNNQNLRMSSVNKYQIDNLYNELCQGFQCPLQRNFEFDSVPAQQFSSIETALDKNSVNYLLERELQHVQGQKEFNGMTTPSKININEVGVSQELKNAFLDQIKLYTLIWTKYQPYIQMSDQYNFVIEYPMFEYVDVAQDKSPVPRGGTSQFQLNDVGRPGLQEILDLIPDYSKLLEQTFSNET